MPRHNRPELGETLRKRFDCDPPASFDTIAPELVPVVIADSGAESFVSRPAMGAHSRGAVAAENSLVQLWNPAGSGIVAQVVGMVMWGGSAMNVHIREYNVALTNVLAQQRWRDKAVNGRPVCQTREMTNVGVLGDLLGMYYMPANTNVRVDLIDSPFYLTPGWGIMGYGTTVNQPLNITFFWNELQERV